MTTAGRPEWVTALMEAPAVKVAKRRRLQRGNGRFIVIALLEADRALTARELVEKTGLGRSVVSNALTTGRAAEVIDSRPAMYGKVYYSLTVFGTAFAAGLDQTPAGGR